MEISDRFKTFTFNLDEDEKIKYVAEKENFLFYYTTLVFVLALIFVPKIIFGRIVMDMTDPIILLSIILMAIPLGLIVYLLYRFIIDYYFTNVYLTNKKIIIVRKNKPTFIPLEQIKKIKGYHNKGLIWLFIQLTQNRSEFIFFVNPTKFVEFCNTTFLL